jgi:hypothetical protein
VEHLHVGEAEAGLLCRLSIEEDGGSDELANLEDDAIGGGDWRRHDVGVRGLGVFFFFYGSRHAGSLVVYFTYILVNKIYGG